MGGLGSSREAEAGFPDQAGPSRSISVERALVSKARSPYSASRCRLRAKVGSQPMGMSQCGSPA